MQEETSTPHSSIICEYNKNLKKLTCIATENYKNDGIKRQNTKLNIKIESKTIEQVRTFKYLDGIINIKSNLEDERSSKMKKTVQEIQTELLRKKKISPGIKSGGCNGGYKNQSTRIHVNRGPQMKTKMYHKFNGNEAPEQNRIQNQIGQNKK